jgi:hypothetical protein
MYGQFYVYRLSAIFTSLYQVWYGETLHSGIYCSALVSKWSDGLFTLCGQPNAQCGRIVCEFEIVPYKNMNKGSLSKKRKKKGRARIMRVFQKLALNYARSSGTHPCIKCDITVVWEINIPFNCCSYVRWYCVIILTAIFVMWFIAVINNTHTSSVPVRSL